MTSIDTKVDAVGACVGVRGTRIKNIVDELGGERIDIVRWNESLQVLIPNALQPAEIDEVMLCQLLGRAIVLVREDQLSLAIGRRGQNVRLASKLVGWDIEIMTSEELDELIEKAVGAFTRIEGVDTVLAEKLVEQGILSFDDLSVMEIVDLVNTIEDLDEETAVAIVGRAEVLAEEQADDMPRRKGARPAAQQQPQAEAPPAAGDAPASIDDLFGDEPRGDDDEPAPEGPQDADPADELEPDPADEELRDLAIAEEVFGDSGDGGEVTSAPSDDDQSETLKIVTEAVEAGASPAEVEANPAGEGDNTPGLPPTEPSSADEAEDRGPDMRTP